MYILLKKKNQQTQTPALKDTPQLEISLSSTQVENYFNTGEKGNYKEINRSWNDSRQYYSTTASSVSLNWQTGGSWARISYLKHPIWKQKFVVIHMTAKHDQTWIHLAANILNVRLFVVKLSTECDYSRTSVHDCRTINVFHYGCYSRICWGSNSEFWNTSR